MLRNSFRIVVCVVSALVMHGDLNAQTSGVFPPNVWGIYTWGGDPKIITPGAYPDIKGVPLVLRWSQLEPRKDDFQFDRLIGESLKAMARNNYYTFLKIYVAPDPNTPAWLYQNGVPAVKFPPRTNPFRKVVTSTFPYYFDEDYIRYYYRMIAEVGRYVQNLPKHLQDRILFVQMAEGSTGDGQAYKVKPLDAQYNIIDTQWSAFRIAAWDQYKKAFTDKKGNLIKPFAVNSDSNKEAEYAWLFQNLPDAIGLKMGMFSHGYDVSETADRLQQYQQTRALAAKEGKLLFSRGEDDEWKTVGWFTRNPEQAFYWSALYALHCELDMWNVPAEAAKGDRFSDAFRFFNRYAGQHDASKSRVAFCALREGLDASDPVKFPVGKFGAADRRDTNRYIRIANAFASHGAEQADARKATGGGMLNRQADRYNDVGWRITTGNYEVFLHQLDPDKTSEGWWHVGPEKSIYGRFARGFNHAAGKTAMYFKLDNGFYRQGSAAVPVTIRIVYLDKGNGQWSLAGNSGNPEMLKVRCTGTGEWKEKTVKIKAALNGGLKNGADLILNYNGGDDTIFHLIEVGL